ncbi:DMT family transporter [Cellulomonas timonensis]|uniref:DMT family transporter n=1 Tax=Cellulomonas timonensis TaxID=1689271 RepID=UPI0008339D32|nr:DMT family transporter [Cellulomonas timonensis]
MIWLAVVAAALLGTSDYLGGALSRKVPLLLVLLGSQVVTTVALVPNLLRGDVTAGGSAAWAWGVAAGVATAVAVASLFRALAIGTMGVVAPITALSALVPVAAGWMDGERLGAVVVGALLIALVGTVLASGPEVRGASGHGVRPIALAVLAACAFGLANLSVARGSATSVPATLFVGAVVTLGLYAAAAMVVWRRLAARPWAQVDRSSLVGIVAIGVIGLLANVCFALASRSGALSLVAVLASLYPVVTVLLGWRLLRERLQPVQVAGVVAVLAGVAVVAAAS